jgi:hypothetical protein
VGFFAFIQAAFPDKRQGERERGDKENGEKKKI